MVKLYTRAGDQGKTSLIGGRVDKDHVQVEAYGSIDELNSFVGLAASLARMQLETNELAEQLESIMQELFDCGSDLAYAVEGTPYKMDDQPAERLENWIDQHTDAAPPLEKFILPGGSQLASTLHICRTICRRAERRVVTLLKLQAVNPEVPAYLNRLSDYFFAAARIANVQMQVQDVEYVRSANVFKGKRENDESK